jgi:hypothetical protein
MTTTAIFAEILIIGLEATVWIGLVIAALFDLEMANLSSLSNWETLITVLVVSGAYALGIIVDRVADSVFDPFDNMLRTISLKGKERAKLYTKMRLEVIGQDDGRAQFLNYVRSRVRVARATAFNLALITAAALFYIARRQSAIAGIGPRQAGAIVVSIGLVLLALAVYAWARISKTYYWRLDDAYKILQEQRPDGSDQPEPAADDPA